MDQRWFVLVCGLALSSVLGTVALGGVSGAASDTLESDLYEARELKIQLAHGFGQAYDEVEFKPRGSIMVRNFKGPKYTVDQEDLTPEILRNLEAVSRQDGYYFLTATVKTIGGEKTFRTFSPVRTLLDSRLQDTLCIHLTPGGDIFSISHSAGRPEVISTPHGQQQQRRYPTEFTTSVTVHSGETGPVPDTAPYLEKMEMERLARERGDERGDNRSFLAKYWMYIVPVALLVLLSSASNPEGGS